MKNIFIVLFILLVILGLSGCAPVQPLIDAQPSQNLQPTQDSQPGPQLFTATIGVPKETEEEPQTATPTATEVPQVYDYSVLTSTQKERLYRASLEYLADTESEALRVANSLEFVEGEGHPATFCGPLSVSILRDAGLVDRYTNLRNFWLLNPRDAFTKEYILEKTFPKQSYQWYQTKTAVNEFDFVEFPLYTGDFLYLYAGVKGTFEHILLVTRVDEAGRAFTITAKVVDDAYLISEQMLYDPTQPGKGYFYQIADKQNMLTTGITGFGGFDLWRPVEPILDPTPEEAAFIKRMDNVFEAYGGEWHVLVKEVGGKTLYALEPYEIIHPASVIKVPMAMMFFEALREREVDNLRLYLGERGTDGRTYKQLLYGLLVDSEEDAADSILAWTEEYFRTSLKLAEWGFASTTLSPRRTTVEEISFIFEGLYQNRWLTSEENDIILEYLAEYTPNDDTRIGVIRSVLPEGSHYYSKRGSLVRGRVIVAETAIIDVEDKVFLISMYGYPGTGEDPPTYDDLQEAIEDASWVVWGYIEDIYFGSN